MPKCSWILVAWSFAYSTGWNDSIPRMFPWFMDGLKPPTSFLEQFELGIVLQVWQVTPKQRYIEIANRFLCGLDSGKLPTERWSHVYFLQISQRFNKMNLSCCFPGKLPLVLRSSVFNSSLSRFEGWQQISGAAMKAKSSAKHADDATVGVLRPVDRSSDANYSLGKSAWYDLFTYVYIYIYIYIFM